MLKPHIQRGRWEAQFKDSCCRDSSAEHVACGKCPCGSREGSSCHLGGVSKSFDFTQISEWILFSSALLIGVIYRKEHTLVLSICKLVCPVAKHTGWLWSSRKNMETLKLEGQMLKEKDGHCLKCKWFLLELFYMLTNWLQAVYMGRCRSCYLVHASAGWAFH